MIAGHFWVLNTPFRRTDFDGSLSMFVQGMGYFFFNAAGVPLFLLMTGYLNHRKTVLDKRYLKGMIRVLTAYVFFSAVTYLFRTCWLHEDISIVQGIRKTLDFSLIPYAWYIEMWIGLFLVTPFLNLGYQAIGSRGQKRGLIVVLYLMTALPNFFNRYGFHLVPGYWACIYPVMFFVIGRYIREYQPEGKGWKLWAAALLPCMVNPLFSELVASGRPMLQIAGDSTGVFGTVQAVAVFLLLYRRDVKNRAAKWLFGKLAMLSLNVYLACYMADKIVYPFFLSHYFETQQQFGLWFFVVVPLIVVLSAVMAQVKEWIFRILRI